jgi:hypothetical protein
LSGGDRDGHVESMIIDGHRHIGFAGSHGHRPVERVLREMEDFRIDGAGISDDDKRMILRDNAVKLLDLGLGRRRGIVVSPAQRFLTM